MANHLWVEFGEPLDAAALTNMLEAINRDRFGGVFAIQHVGGDTWDIKQQTVVPFGFWLETRTRLEWRHPADPTVTLWAQNTFAAMLVRMLDPNARIHDDGIEETLAPDFDQKYPTVRDWMEAFAKGLGNGALGITIPFETMIGGRTLPTSFLKRPA